MCGNTNGKLHDDCKKIFHKKRVCYVNQPSTCKDIIDSPELKGKQASAEACEGNRGF